VTTRFDPPALGHDVRPTPQKLRGHAGRKGEVGIGRGGRPRNRQASIRPLAEQGRELIARERDRFIELHDLLARRGQRDSACLTSSRESMPAAFRSTVSA